VPIGQPTIYRSTRKPPVCASSPRRNSEPKTVDVVEIASNKAAIGKIFKREAKDILAAIGKLNEPEAVAALESLEQSLKTNNEMHLEVTVNETVNTYQLTPEMVQVKRYQKVVHVEEFVPNVIEPSFWYRTHHVLHFRTQFPRPQR